ncbi:hypothetical protein OH77DRAFT_397030 [Trametes cingulata]|nr:hypothetical protein OH77DRAFT_397030 [Trametes cingulata]
MNPCWARSALKAALISEARRPNVATSHRRPRTFAILSTLPVPFFAQIWISATSGSSDMHPLCLADFRHRRHATLSRTCTMRLDLILLELGFSLRPKMPRGRFILQADSHSEKTFPRSLGCFTASCHWECPRVVPPYLATNASPPPPPFSGRRPMERI